MSNGQMRESDRSVVQFPATLKYITKWPIPDICILCSVMSYVYVTDQVALGLIDVYTSYDVWYIDWYCPYTSCWLGDYSFVIGIHFAGCDCDCWIRFFCSDMQLMHWQATRWVIYNTNSKDMFCMCVRMFNSVCAFWVICY